MNKQIIVLTHNDLDGAVCAIIVKKALEVIGIDEGLIRFITCGYDDVQDKIKNITIKAEKLNISYALFITDLNINKDDVELILSDNSCKSLTYIDHHPKDFSLDEFSHDSRFRYEFNEHLSAAKLTFSFYCDVLKDFKKISRLVYLTDIYDCWRSDHDHFPFAMDLNELFWKYGFEEFVKEFSFGYDLSDEDFEYVKEVREKKKIYFQEVEKNHKHVIPLNDDNELLFITNPEGKYINDVTLFFPNYAVYLIMKGVSKTHYIFSGRSKEQYRYDINNIAKEILESFPDAKCGGHRAAGGFLIPKQYELENFVERFIEICEQL